MPALDQSDRTSDIDSLFVSVLLDGPLSEERGRTMSFDKRLLFNKDCSFEVDPILFTRLSNCVHLKKKKKKLKVVY